MSLFLFLFSFHYGLLSFGCQGNRHNLFVLSLFVEYGRVPHGSPSVPTHCFIISWILRQNVGSFGKYIKEGGKLVSYVYNNQQSRIQHFRLRQQNGSLQNRKSYKTSIINFRYAVIITVQIDGVTDEQDTSHLI
jgi:hypothetical protein